MALTDKHSQALVFAERYSGRVRYLADRNLWLRWNGQVWRPDPAEGEPLHLAAALLRDFGFEDKGNHPADELQRRARTLPGIGIETADLDSRPELLNTPAGVVDLAMGNIRPHDPNLLMTQITGVGIGDPKGCPTWRSFLQWFTGEDQEYLRSLLRLMGGEWLTGKNRMQKLFILQGRGMNGKSTLLTALRHIWGDYATVAAPGLIEKSVNDAHPCEIAQLAGKRLALLSETGAGSKIDVPKVKRMTGDEKQWARGMRENPWEFTAQYSLVMGCNDLPELHSSGLGDWRRMMVLPAHQTVTDPDPELLDKLKAEGADFLAHLIRESVAYHTYGWKSCDAIEAATKKYREANDLVWAFLDCCCREGNGLEVQSRNLWEAYCSFAFAAGEETGSETAFGRRMGGQLGFRKQKRAAHNVYLGLELLPPDDRRELE